MRSIIATDGSEASLKAAATFARHFCPGADDEIFIIYVFPEPPDAECYRNVVSLPKDARDDRVAAVARPVLAKTRQVLVEIASTVHEVTLLGNPAKEIVEFATNLGVGLIVAGTRGRSPERELYLGSVSSALAHQAPCSVLIVR